MKLLRVGLLVACSALVQGTALAEDTDKPILLDAAQWQALREQPQRYENLLRDCERNIDRAAQPVARLVSVAHYNKDGVNDNGREAAKQLSLDGWMAYRAALCYKLDGDPRFAHHAQQILDAWGSTLHTVEGRQGKADINFDLPSFVIAGYLVQGVDGWNDDQWRQFLREVVAPQSSAYTGDNNHGSWGVLLNAALGAALHDDELLQKTQTRWQALLQEQVDDEGKMPKEICRSDTSNWCGGETKGIKGMAYTHYALLPTTVAAQILEQQGYGVWQTSAGEALDKAYARAAKWTQHPETFPYYAANNGELIGVRNGDYFALLQRHYPNDDGAQALADGDQGLNHFRLALLFPTGE